MLFVVPPKAAQKSIAMAPSSSARRQEVNRLGFYGRNATTLWRLSEVFSAIGRLSDHFPSVSLRTAAKYVAMAAEIAGRRRSWPLPTDGDRELGQLEGNSTGVAQDAGLDFDQLWLDGGQRNVGQGLYPVRFCT